MKHEMIHERIIFTWRTAVEIYCAVLRNPDADFSAVENAKGELLRLADIVDNLTRDKK
jgi:hypothetical protein